MKKLMILAATFAALAASAAVTITDVSARQRWPWNGLVDIDFTISGAAAGEAFAIDIDATASAGTIPLNAKTYAVEPVAGVGTNRIVWDLAADYPEFRANDLRISVTATPISSDKAIYMVIDLSGGSTATKYPVRYTTQAPAHVQGAANEPCQTTELWMRRIVAPDFAFSVNSYTVSTTQKDSFYGKMTKDYYIGVFELTQKQYQLVMGSWPNSWFTNELYRASRPLEALKFNTLTGTRDDTQASPSSITASSFLGKIRSKTGLPINMPSNIQLNFAQRGGTRLPSGSEFYCYAVNGSIPSDRAPYCRCRDNVAITSPERDCDVNSGTAYVGSYPPNGYGLYDTIGNVREYTAEYPYSQGYKAYYQARFGDSAIGLSMENPVVDPPGVLPSEASNTTGWIRKSRDGAFIYLASYFNLWTSENIDSSSSDGSSGLREVGLRLAFTCE